MLNKRKKQNLCFVNKAVGNIKIEPLNHEKEEDYKIFKEIVCDINIMKTSSVFNKSITKNESILRDLFIKMSISNKNHNIGFNKIVDADNNLIGIGGITVIKEDKLKKIKTLELGYLLKNSYHGKKIGSEFAFCILNHITETYGNQYEIVATALPENTPSQIILLKLGFLYIEKRIKHNVVVNVFRLPEGYKLNTYQKVTRDYVEELKKINKEHFYISEKLEECVL